MVTNAASLIILKKLDLDFVQSKVNFLVMNFKIIKAY